MLTHEVQKIFYSKKKKSKETLIKPTIRRGHVLLLIQHQLLHLFPQVLLVNVRRVESIAHELGHSGTCRHLLLFFLRWLRVAQTAQKTTHSLFLKFCLDCCKILNYVDISKHIALLPSVCRWWKQVEFLVWHCLQRYKIVVWVFLYVHDCVVFAWLCELNNNEIDGRSKFFIMEVNFITNTTWAPPTELSYTTTLSRFFCFWASNHIFHFSTNRKKSLHHRSTRWKHASSLLAD